MSRYWKLVGRALRLVCPVCGRGPLFRGLLTMHENCSHCGAKFEREPGFFLGSIYINYGITALVTLAGYIAMMLTRTWENNETLRLILLLTVAVILPILLHRHARSLWLGFDQWHDPRPEEK
jgi:uncharacterized protein (DUF983 family)